MVSSILLLSILPGVLAQGAAPKLPPATGDNGRVGGIFGMGMPKMSDLGSMFKGTGGAAGAGAGGGAAAKGGDPSLGALGSAFGGAGPEAPKGRLSPELAKH